MQSDKLFLKNNAFNTIKITSNIFIKPSRYKQKERGYTYNCYLK